ncbi:hypothetical protein, partial [Aquimarina addita]|uniref:hypothetical protein n=1 Tax=Aquimarina addita TaxID=870485 RepID=UPI0031EF219B
MKDLEEFFKLLDHFNLFLIEENEEIILKRYKDRVNNYKIDFEKEKYNIIDFIKDNKGLLIEILKKEKRKDNSNRDKIYKLSPLQEGMLFHGLYDEDSKAYVVQLIVDFPKGLNIDYLKSS